MTLKSNTHYFLWFYVITLLIPIGMVMAVSLFPHLLFGLESIDSLFTLLDETAENSNIMMRGTALVPFILVSFKAPVLWLINFVVAAPTIAAGIMTFIYFGPKGCALLLQRLKPWVSNISTRKGWRIWRTLLVAMLSLMLSQFALAKIVGLTPTFAWGVNIFSSTFLWFYLSAMFLDQGGLLEELGWRGYAAPILQRMMRTPLHATLMIGFFWALWHIPLHGTEFNSLLELLIQEGAFFASTISVSILIQYFSNKLGGSVLAAMTIHGLTNDSVGIGGTGYETGNLAVLFIRTLPFMIASILVVFIAGSQLGFEEDSVHNLSLD